MNRKLNIQCWVCKDEKKYDQWKMEDHFKNEHIADSNTVSYVCTVFRLHKSIQILKQKIRHNEKSSLPSGVYENILLNERLEFAKSFLETI